MVGVAGSSQVSHTWQYPGDAAGASRTLTSAKTRVLSVLSSAPSKASGESTTVPVPARSKHSSSVCAGWACGAQQKVNNQSVDAVRVDEAKRLHNLKDHGIDLEDARKVFAGPTFMFEDDRLRYAERRFITLGLHDGVPVSIAHTETEHVIRPISFRRATTRETAIEKIADQLPSPPIHEGR